MQRDNDPSIRADGDPAAITRSVYPPLLRLAKAAGCGDSAEDWVQEALIETLRRYPGFRGVANPEAYIRTVLLRLVSKSRLRTKRHIAREIQAASLLVREDSSLYVEDRLSGSNLISHLPLRQRACVYLSVVCELSDQEAATVMGCRPSTVRSNVARGLARLKRDAELSPTRVEET
jgi:RNA polymerase sigma factor (sigma-70 family)